MQGETVSQSILQEILQMFVGAVISTIEQENGKESFNGLQDHILQYVMEKYEKGVDLAPLIRHLREGTLDNKEPTAPRSNITPATL